MLQLGPAMHSLRICFRCNSPKPCEKSSSRQNQPASQLDNDISVLASKPASGSFMHVGLLPNTRPQANIRSPKKSGKITHGETSVS